MAEYDETRLVRLTGQIRVSVEMTPNWIPVEQRDVTVEVVGDDVELSAQAVGNGAAVEFTDLPAGSYFVSVRRNGFTARFKRILVDDGAATPEVVLSTRLTNLAQAELDLSGVELDPADLRNVRNLKRANLSGIILGPGLPNNRGLCGWNLKVFPS